MAILKSRFTKVALVGLVVTTLVFGYPFSGNETISVQTVGAASVDYFLQIDGIEGESTETNRKGAIDIQSFSWGAALPGIENSSSGSGGGGGSGKAKVEEVSFLSNASKASPLLMKAAATGQHIKNAKLFVRKAGERQNEFYTIELKDVLVSSYKASGQSGDLPKDTFELSFTKIEYSVKGLDSTVTTTYDLKTNK